MEFDVKRLHLQGVLVHAHCPECGEVVTLDLGERHLSYPSTGVQDLTMYHEAPDGAEHEWKVKVDLRVELVAVEGCEVQVTTND